MEASDVEAAEALVLRDYPDGSVKAEGDELVTAENRHRMLAKWMQTLNV